MFYDFKPEDKQEFLGMCREFYSSNAVNHTVGDDIFNTTFDFITGGSAYARGLMIRANGQNVGYLQLSFTYSAEVGGLVVLLEEIYIREKFRGMGIGKKAFEFIEREYPDMKRLRLEVTNENIGAIRLYERLGFKPLTYMQMVIEK